MTPKLVLVPFDPAHVRLMEFGRPEMSGMVSLQTRADYAVRLAQAGPAYTLYDKRGIIIGAAGIGTYWSGVGEAWALLSSLADRYMFSIHKIVKTSIPRLAVEMNLHRLQTVVPAKSDRALGWAERLGFKSEGIMRQYGPDKGDYYRFARIF